MRMPRITSGGERGPTVYIQAGWCGNFTGIPTTVNLKFLNFGSSREHLQTRGEVTCAR